MTKSPQGNRLSEGQHNSPASDSFANIVNGSPSFHFREYITAFFSEIIFQNGAKGSKAKMRSMIKAASCCWQVVSLTGRQCPGEGCSSRRRRCAQGGQETAEKSWFLVFFGDYWWFLGEFWGVLVCFWRVLDFGAKKVVNWCVLGVFWVVSG